MADTLDDLLAALPKGVKGQPGVHVPQDGDCLFVYVDDVPYRAVYVDPILTVFEALDDGRLVAFQLKELSALVAVERLTAIRAAQHPPIVDLLFESFRIDHEGVEPSWRVQSYARAARAVAPLDPQSA